MYLQRLFVQYAEERERSAVVDRDLEARLASRMFSARHRLIHQSICLMKKSILYSSLAGTAVAAVALVVAPASFANAMEQAVAEVREGFHILVSRPFDPSRDTVSDEQLRRLSEDPTISRFDYERGENGENFSLTKECDTTNGPCVIEIPGEGSVTATSDETDPVQVRVTSGTEDEDALVFHPEANEAGAAGFGVTMENGETTLVVEQEADGETGVATQDAHE